MLSLTTRRIILIASVLVFFIVGPLIVGYAMGYRYDFSANRLYKTGLIYLKSRPWLVDVFFEGENVSWYTPTQINNIKPGSYHVTVNKEGYQEWQKELFVEAEHATTAEDILLFLQQPTSENLSAQQPINFLISPDHRNFIFQKDDPDNLQLAFLGISNNNVVPISLPLGSDQLPLRDWQWSPDNQAVLLKYGPTDNQQFAVVNTSEPDQPIILKQLFKLDFDQVSWDQDSQNLLFIQGGNLHRLKLRSREIGAPLAIQAKAFTTQNSELYIIKDSTTKDTAKKDLVVTDTQGENERVLSQVIPKSSRYLLAVSDQGQVAFSTAANNLYLTQDDTLQLLGTDVRDFTWSRQDKDEEDKLLWHNEYEIRVYNDHIDRNDIVTSFSQPIQGAVWYPDFEHVIYQYQDEIYVIELDGRGQHNQALLATTPITTPLATTRKGQGLFLIMDQDGQKKILKLGIQ